MDTLWIVGICVGACALAVVAFIAHGRLASTGERAGCTSMFAFVLGWVAVLTAVITGALSVQPAHGQWLKEREHHAQAARSDEAGRPKGIHCL